MSVCGSANKGGFIIFLNAITRNKEHFISGSVTGLAFAFNGLKER